MERVLPNYPNCYICGESNPSGLHLEFKRDEEKVTAYCSISENYAGYRGIVHGGTLAAILDEALGRIIAGITKQFVVTGDLHLRFHRPLLVGTPIKIEAKMNEQKKPHHRFWEASGKVIDKESQIVYTSATGRFFPMSKEKEQEILESLKLKGNQRPVTLEDL